ncbi:MAG: hypothetical protein D5R97_07160 [Candidatus Syntrophonatronum acetioxidans]|uniref:DUF5317 domain-containing protein n=1 Tax=Candidatus Syntrophonatronum acetioxidans TaxID=1795816 RepID=A0A424YCZ5_9FIRM|nr:MAG: hypothetical protein D5R97_07160 [Candidatus Syntrophonatronum acetioxidans]
MLIEGVMLAAIIGWLRGGRLENILEVNLKGVSLIFFALFIRFFTAGMSKSIDFFMVYGGALQVLAYLLLFWAFWQNRDRREIWLVGAGSFFNFLVIAANGGKMPVCPQAVSQVGLSLTETGTHVLLNEATRLKILADIIALPPPYPLPMVISGGDVILVLGVILFVQRGMLGVRGAIRDVLRHR